MHVLDNPGEIKKIDKTNVYGSIEALPEQCLHAWEDVEKIKIPSDYQDFKNIIVCGMGGSSLGAHVIQALFEDKLKIPLILSRDYHLPAFVDKDTLVVLSSYSGTTEETISCVKEAITKKLRCFVISTGGELEEIAKQNKFPFYKIIPKFNPSNQPRMAIGYSIFGQIAIFARLGLVNVTKQQVINLTGFLKSLNQKYKLSVPQTENQAKQLAVKVKDKIINLVAAEHLQGALHVFNNQLNENSKSFSNFFYIPELNHHLMEGLRNPDSLKENSIFVFFKSELYSEKIQKRFNITKEVVKKNGLPIAAIKLTGENKLEQCFELIGFGAYVNFYLAMLYKINPAPIPWVDYFKAELKKASP